MNHELARINTNFVESTEYTEETEMPRRRAANLLKKLFEYNELRML